MTSESFEKHFGNLRRKLALKELRGSSMNFLERWLLMKLNFHFRRLKLRSVDPDTARMKSILRDLDE